MTRHFEIVVAGAGPAGLAAACLLAKAGCRVALIGGIPAKHEDVRTVALMQPSITVLAKIGVWPGTLRENVAPLRKLCIVDDTGAAYRAPSISFDPAEIGHEVFGWNIPLSLLLPALHIRAAELGAEIFDGNVLAARVSESSVDVTASAGNFPARAAVAADGRKSVLRDAAGIARDQWDYNQTAIATSFDHSASHDGISTEYHRAAGLFTTVPLPGNRSSLVWLERPERTSELMAMDKRAFAAEIQIASHGHLGRISGIGSRQAFPMHGLTARRFAAKRTLLVGEAGHVAPPIGAQGLNMALRDAADAANAIARADDPGADGILQEYDRMRRRDVLPRQRIVDVMNRSLLSNFLPLEMARAFGLELIAGVPPLRRHVMRHGLGLPSYDEVGNLAL